MTALMDHDTLLHQLVQSPRLRLLADEIEGVLDRERAARQRFYDTMTEGDKVEFINGEVVVQSPVKLEHNRAGKLLQSILDAYVDVHGLGHVGHEKLLVSLTRNDYEPDVCFWGRAKADAFQRDQMRFPAPDFVVEVLSPSTEDVDRGVKLEDYGAHGVAEYWLVDPATEVVEQYVLAGGRYELRLKVHDGPLACAAVPGFVVPVRAIFDEQANLAALKALLGA
jgi:Uma2 family endonuclease